VANTLSIVHTIAYSAETVLIYSIFVCFFLSHNVCLNAPLAQGVNYNGKSFYGISSGACIIKLITAVIYDFRNKLECLSQNTRLGWKGLPGTNTVTYYGNH
jgi:hypothetical protein